MRKIGWGLLLLSGTLKAYPCESIARGLRAWIEYRSDWRKSIDAPIDLSTVGERVDLLIPTPIYKKHLFNKETFNYFIGGPYPDHTPKGPIEAEEYVFNVALADGSPHEIRVILGSKYAAPQGMGRGTYARYLVSKLPYLTVRATRSIEVTPEPPYDPDGILFSRGQADHNGHIYLRPQVGRGRWRDTDLTLLWHEHGHNVGGYLFANGFTDHYFPSFWQKIMDSDKGTVDVHTAGPTEDFAEAFSEYFASRGGRMNPELREDHLGRFRAFDAIYRQDWGGLAPASEWEAIRAYHQAVGKSQALAIYAGGALACFLAPWLF